MQFLSGPGDICFLFQTLYVRLQIFEVLYDNVAAALEEDKMDVFPPEALEAV